MSGGEKLTQLTNQQSSITGVAPNFVAATAGGDSFLANKNTSLIVKNGGAAAITVTIPGKRQCNQGSLHDLSISVAAGAEQYIGPFAPSDAHVDPQTYLVDVNYSSATSVTVATIEN